MELKGNILDKQDEQNHWFVSADKLKSKLVKFVHFKRVHLKQQSQKIAF